LKLFGTNNPKAYLMMIIMIIIIIIIIIKVISGTKTLSGLWLHLGFSPMRLNHQVFIQQFLIPAFLLSLLATPIRFSLSLSALRFSFAL
jgi:hypothetical protein